MLAGGILLDQSINPTKLPIQRCMDTCGGTVVLTFVKMLLVRPHSAAETFNQNYTSVIKSWDTDCGLPTLIKAHEFSSYTH